MIIDAVELKRRYLQRIAGVRDKKVYIGPELVDLFINNACNLSCKFCWTHAPGNSAHFDKARFLSWERFLSVVRDSVDLKVDQIKIVGSGEPTMHPLFRDMMRHLEHQPLKIRLNTNATFVLDYCLDVVRADHVIINLAAVDRQQYFDLYGKDLFDRVVANIKRLVSLRDAHKPKFHIEISYIINSININQKQKMRDLATQLGVNSVSFWPMIMHQYNREIALPNGSVESEKRRSPPACLHGWFNIVIHAEGHASTCCQVDRMPLGDFDKLSFKQLWLSQTMMNMRLLGKYGHIQKMYKACQTCPFYTKNIRRSKLAEARGIHLSERSI